MEKASRLFITRDFSTFKEWFISMFTGHTDFMQADGSQVAAFTSTSWILREENPGRYISKEYLHGWTWYTDYGELWNEEESDFFKFPENLHVVYLDKNLDDDDVNFLIKKIEQMSDKISIYTYGYSDDFGDLAKPIL